MDTRLLVCLKAPLPGLVKTRLAAGLGNNLALAAYRAMVTDVMAAVDASGLPTTLWYAPAGQEAAAATRTLCGSGRELLPQTGGDLGARMDAAFRRSFADGAQAAILVGGDLPLLTAAILRQASDRLDHARAVLGPAEDGGYYLIGFTRDGYVPEAFAAMPWSTPEVAARTLDACRRAGSPPKILPALRDCDTPGDLRELAGTTFRKRLRGTAFGTFLAGLPRDSFDQIPTHRLFLDTP